MRAREIAPLIIAAIEAIVPDEQTSARDRFCYVPDETDGEDRPQRAFLLVQGQLSPSTTYSPLNRSVTYRLIVSYQNEPGVAARMLDDGERIMNALWGLQGNVHPDLCGVRTMGDWIPTDAGEGRIDCQLDFAIAYSGNT